MPKIWLTYSWDDNASGDVDFIDQQLQRAGADVKRDRWNLIAGRRLWEQIGSQIADPDESDAWLFFASSNSVSNQKCLEEYAYALNRALQARGQAYPILALFQSREDIDFLPPGLQTRLCVSLADADWCERIIAGAEDRVPQIDRPVVEPYYLSVTEHPIEIELRPRGGSWAPYYAGVLRTEADNVNFKLARRAAGTRSAGGIHVSIMPITREAGPYWIEYHENEVTPSMSMYMRCRQLPTRIVFGKINGTGFVVDLPSRVLVERLRLTL